MMTVGEMPGIYDVQNMLKYVQPGKANLDLKPRLAFLTPSRLSERQELQMAFDFALVSLDSGRRRKPDDKGWSLEQFKEVITRWNEGLYDGWWAIYLEK